MAFDKRDRYKDARPKTQERTHQRYMSGLYDGKKIIRGGKHYIKEMFYYSFSFFKDKLERIKKLKRLIHRRKMRKEHPRRTTK